MSSQDESRGFLNRWSARKQRPNTEQAQPLAAENGEFAGVENRDVVQPLEKLEHDSKVDTVEQGGAQQIEGAELIGHSAIPAAVPAESAVGDSPTQALLLDADMPSIESLTADSDVSGFFSKGVSAALRKAALRHVFRQPQYNLRDGLNDYDGDFTSFEPLGDTVTADMKFHAARKEMERLEAERLSQQQAENAAEEVAEHQSLLATDEVADVEVQQSVTVDESDLLFVLAEYIEADTNTNGALLEADNPKELALTPVDDHAEQQTKLPDVRQPREKEE